jgi:glutamyl-tRNA synthetase
MLGFLFTDERSFTLNAADAPMVEGDGRRTVEAARESLAALDHWDTASIEAALRGALVDGLGLKPRDAFGPVRVAVTGRRVSPPLFESLELLGRERSLARLAQG